MKRSIIIAGLGMLSIMSCKEKAPPIDYGTSVKASDTSYLVSPVPAADAHNVLVEDFTGPTCPNCPVAKQDYLHPLDSQYSGRLNTIGLYVTDFSQTQPVEPLNKYDFRDSSATSIEQNIYQALYAMPMAGIDRMPLGQASQGSVYQIQKDSWTGDIVSQLAVADSMNLFIHSNYDSTTGLAAITVRVTYLYPTGAAHSLSVAVVEDGLVDLQEFPTYTDTFYTYNDVFRAMVTSVPFGDAILPTLTAKEAGRVEEKVYLYKPKSTSWKLANCRIIAFIHRGASGGGAHVYQSAQCKFKG